MSVNKCGLILIGAVLAGSTVHSQAWMRPAKLDFNGDGKSELAVFDNGVWTVTTHDQSYFRGNKSVGDKASQLVPGVFNGGRSCEVAVFKGGLWEVQAMNESRWIRRAKFGFSGSIAVPGDYDGDGKTDLAVYAQGVWYILQSEAGYRQVSFGFNGGRPLAGDFNGDGKDDLVIVWDDIQTRELKWSIYFSSNNIKVFGFGPAGSIPVPGRYEGNAAMQPAIYWVNPVLRKGYFYISRTGGVDGNPTILELGRGVGLPVGGCDFDGDGKDDIALYNEGAWLLGMSRANGKAMTFGYKGAKAVGAL